MAHGERAQRNSSRGKEYWASRLHRYGEQPGRETKLLTHRHERRVGDRETQQLAVEAENEALFSELGGEPLALRYLIEDPWDDVFYPYP